MDTIYKWYPNSTTLQFSYRFYNKYKNKIITSILTLFSLAMHYKYCHELTTNHKFMANYNLGVFYGR